MKALSRLVLSSLLLGGTVAGVIALAADSKDAPWVALFNGKDLSGWVKVHDVTFEVVDGNLRLVKGMGWLRTEKEYQDFVLELEWRALVADYDSGIFVRCGLEGKPWPNEGWQINLKQASLCSLVKGYKTVVPSETPRVPVNKWVKGRIEVRGKKIKMNVDGEDAWEHDGIDREKGYIGIQVEEKSFDFRNLRIQELKPAQ